MSTEIITDARFRQMLRDCGEAWRLEHQRDALPFEMVALQAWRDEHPVTPDDFPEWAEWLEFTRTLGDKITRIRLIDEPPTEYQRCAMHSIPFHEAAGDHIRLMPLGLAVTLGIIPGSNGWLFDSEHLVIVDNGMMLLVTDEKQVTIYRVWRDLTMSLTAAAVVSFTHAST